MRRSILPSIEEVMMRKSWALALLVLLGSGAALAQVPLDLDALDPAMVADFLGNWTILNADGSKSCKVTLSRAPAIGGMVLDADPDLRQGLSGYERRPQLATA